MSLKRSSPDFYAFIKLIILKLFLPVFTLAVMTFLPCCRHSGEERHCATTECHEELSESEESDMPADITEEAWRMADSILAGMTLEEKVGQCFMPTIFSRVDETTSARLKKYIDSLHVGGIVLLKGNLSDASSMALQGSMARVPLFTAIDAEWGLGMRLRDAPCFPRNGNLSPEADERLLFDYGREVGLECRSVGINMVLGPVVDVAENPTGVIGSRSFGSDPRKVADLGVAYARGVESVGVISVAKHFPGHGSPAVDSHLALPVIARSLHQLDSVDLYPFKTYVDAGLSGVMVGHLAVPAVDPESLPAAVSEIVINGLLRNELEFDGLVLTDALNMGAVKGYTAIDALKAGADIVIGPADTAEEIKEVTGCVKRGEFKENEIDKKCRRILFYKLVRETSRNIAPYNDRLSKDMQRSASSLIDSLSNHKEGNQSR